MITSSLQPLRAYARPHGGGRQFCDLALAQVRRPTKAYYQSLVVANSRERARRGGQLAACRAYPRVFGFEGGPRSSRCFGIMPRAAFSTSESCGSNTRHSEPFFVASATSLPHPEKDNGVGEDAHFLSTRSVGVADGVGGWVELGIDAGMFSREVRHT